jgi:cytochrome b561
MGFIMGQVTPMTRKIEFINFHKASGTIILLLTILRIMWKLTNIKVMAISDLPNWQKNLAHSVHFTLYILIFIMTISGIFMSILGGRAIDIYSIFIIEALDTNMVIAGICRQIHQCAAIALISIIILHIFAALYHHFVKRDNVLIRMIK